MTTLFSREAVVVGLLVVSALHAPLRAQTAPCPNGRQIAFPGAEGFGRCAQGGRGGRVMEVTTLAEDGPGTLRECLEAQGARTCVFRVGGEIKLTRPIHAHYPYITVAGQTAPGGGIEISGDWLDFRTGDVIIRHVRLREGNPDPGSNTATIYIMNPDPDVWNGDQTLWSENAILDHVSASWSADDNIGIWGRVRNVTVQWSISSENGGGMLTSGGQDGLSVHHNLFATNSRRTPAAGGKTDVVNNVIYNTPYMPTLISGWSYNYSQPAFGNVVNNYYKEGPWTDSHSAHWGPNPAEIQFLYVCNPIWPNSCEASAASESFHSGNLVRKTSAGSDEPARIENGYKSSDSSPGTIRMRTSRHPYPQVNTTSAGQAYIDVLANAGAMPRDAIDQRVIDNAKNRTSPYPYMWTYYDPPGSNWQWTSWDPNTTVGWPHPANGTPPADTDRDGMPNSFETQYAFNPNSAADGPLDKDGDGYTNLEEFLNTTNPNVADGASVPPPPPPPTTPPPPTPPPPPPAGSYTLNATPTSVAPGGQLTAAFTAPSGHSATDWIGLYPISAPDSDEGLVSYQYVPAGTGGSLTFAAPTTSGSFHLRYYTNSSHERAAVSQTISVGGAPPPAATDVNGDGQTNITDVQLVINQALGIAACATGDIDGSGACNVTDVQRVINAALGL